MASRAGQKPQGTGSTSPSPQPRRTWLPRVLAGVVLLLWLAVGGFGGPLIGKLVEVQKNDNAAFLPAASESTAVLDALPAFVDNPALPFLVVMQREPGLDPADQQAATDYLAGVEQLPMPALGPEAVLGDFLTGPVVGPVPSQDGQALLGIVNLDSTVADASVEGASPLSEATAALRSSATALTASGLATYVTGPGGTIADFAAVFEGIDGLLLGVALIVVLVILLIVYRSPILPVVVLVGAVFGLALAGAVIYPLAKSGTIALSGQSQGILFILVVGATTDYSLLLVARYKEALHDTASTWAAMKVAWRASVEPIVASGSTVILGLLCLLLSDLGSTKGLGPVGAIGIAGAMVAALTFLPAVLLVIGRRVFWPRIPKIDHEHAEDALGRRGLWGRLAGMIGARPRRTWALTLLGLLAAAAFLPTLKASGVSQTDTFLSSPESVTGQQVLARHFPAGSGSPVQVLVPEADAQRVLTVLQGEQGLSEAAVGLVPGEGPKVVDGRVIVQATLVDAPDSPAATDVVQRLRGDLDAVTPEALVGGDTAVQLDVVQASERDLKVIIPAILAVIFVVLALLLRSLVAPLLLLAANVLSFAATLGISALVFNHVFGFAGADPSTPLYGFVFLVALGIDYSIFLMTRVREESAVRGTRPGVLVGLAVTGGVITSAGIVLAATFSALAVLPLLFLAQIAFIVAFGVLLDTTVVRSVLVPALVHDLGERTWWPGRPGRGRHSEATQDATGLSPSPAAPDA